MKEDNKKYFSNKLNEISALKEGWVIGGLPISQAIIDYTHDVLFECDNDDLENWNIGPFVNGSIILSYKDDKKHASINIAEASISYFYEVGKIFNKFQGSIEDGFGRILSLIKFIHLYEDDLVIDENDNTVSNKLLYVTHNDLHESYVSILCAKLLKELDFDWKVLTYFEHNRFNRDISYADFNHIDLGEREVISAPSIHIVQTWLREKHGYDIDIRTLYISKENKIVKYYGIASTLQGALIETHSCQTYEEALSYLIYKILSNLKNETVKA